MTSVETGFGSDLAADYEGSNNDERRLAIERNIANHLLPPHLVPKASRPSSLQDGTRPGRFVQHEI